MNWNNNAGPRRGKVAIELTKTILWQGKTTIEDGCEVTILFGNGPRRDVVDRLAALMERHGSTLTVANIKTVVNELTELLAWTKANRPVETRRSVAV